MPGTVVEVANLFLVLKCSGHGVVLFLTLGQYQVVNTLKVFAILK